MSIDIKKIKTKWYTFLPQLSLLIWFTIYLLLDCIHHAPAISILSSVFWVVTWGIVLTSFVKEDLGSGEIEESEEPNNQDDSLVWYGKFLSRNAVETIIHLIINVFIFSLIFVSIKEYNNNLTDIINNYNYQLFYNCGSILLSIAVSTSCMESIFNVESKRNRRIIYIATIIVGLCGAGLIGISASYLPEKY